MLAPQASELLINADRNLVRYARTGYAVFADDRPGFRGPPAGMLTGLARTSHDRFAFVPCDSPHLPNDLVSHLLAGMENGNSPAAMVHDGTRAHPVCAVPHRNCAATIRDGLATGRYRVEDAMQRLGTACVDFSDRPDTFINITGRKICITVIRHETTACVYAGSLCRFSARPLLSCQPSVVAAV